MAPSPGTSADFGARPPLTLENLESLPKNNRSVDSFVNEQRRNARFYATGALSDIDQLPTISSKPRTNYSKPNRLMSPQMITASPLLKSRLEMQHELVSDADATPPIPRKSVQKKSQQKELFKGLKHAREDLTDGKVVQKPINKSKRPRSPSDDEDECAARLKERRDRKRARKEIIKPRAVTPEQSINGDSEAQSQHKQTKKSDGKKPEEAAETELTIKKKKGRGKTAAGISLMETFTANNVKKSRLTLQPQNSGRLFKQARSGEAVKLGTKEKENERSASNFSKPSGAVRKSKPNPLETYSNYPPKAPRNANASHGLPKSHPKSDQSVVDGSVSDSNSACERCSDEYQTAQYEAPKQPHKRALSYLGAEDDVEAVGRVAYSDSWGIGSQLPSDASSVHQSQHSTLRKATIVARADATPSRVLTVASEPKITTLTTPWNFDDPRSAFGIFRHLNQESPRLERDAQEKGEPIPTTGQESIAPARSRFFFSPLVHIPERVQNAVAKPAREEHVDNAAPPADVQDSGTHQPQLAYTAVVADEQQTEYGLSCVRQPSPIDSLDRLLHEHDAEDALYGHLYGHRENRRFFRKRPRVQTVHEYDMEPRTARVDQFDDHAYQYENNEVYNSYCIGGDSNGSFTGHGDNDGAVINDPMWEQCGHGYFYERNSIEPEGVVYYGENGEGDGACQPGAYSDIDADIVEDVYVGDEGNVWQDITEEEVWEAGEELEWFDAQEDVGVDVLPFAEGRTLLLGLGNDAPLTRSVSRTGTREQQSSTYGQSVQEIEVMAARQLAHHW